MNEMMNYKQCFVNVHCSIDCPNFQIDIANERYGYGIAEDMGIEKISCKKCFYNTGKCDDCLFFNDPECAEYEGKNGGFGEWLNSLSKN